MPRASERKLTIEAERLALLHSEQGKLRRRIQKETKVKKKGNQPGEEMLKKNTAVLLKIGVPGISYGDIADRLGETRATVREWFKNDPDVKDFYTWAVDNLKEGALELMKTYALEAVETLVLLMRFGSEKYMFEAAREILDRVGVPKVERHENQNENISKHQWADRDALVSEIRELTPELQEQAITALEGLEELLAGQNNNGNGNGLADLNDGDISDLQPIGRDDEEDEEVDDDESED